MDKCPLSGDPCPHLKTIHISDVENYKVTIAKHLCIVCGLSYLSKKYGDTYKNSGELYESLMQMIKGSTEMVQKEQPKLVNSCPSCGYTIEEIKISGKVGCAGCYQHFKKILMPFILRYQQNATKHVGKAPKIITKTLAKLEEQLNIAITKEDYETAARLRNEIKFLKSK